MSETKDSIGRMVMMMVMMMMVMMMVLMLMMKTLEDVGEVKKGKV